MILVPSRGDRARQTDAFASPNPHLAGEPSSQCTMTVDQTQGIGSSGKVAKKVSLAQRFFCCFPLTSDRMLPRPDRSGVGSIESGGRGSRHPSRRPSFQGGISALAGLPRVRTGSLLGKGGGRSVAWSGVCDTGAFPTVGGPRGRRPASKFGSLQESRRTARQSRATYGSPR